MLPDYCQAEAQGSRKGGQERGKEYIRICRKKGCGGNAVAPHTHPGVSELPLQWSFKENSGLYFPPDSKNFKLLPVQEHLVVSRSLWTSSWFSARFSAEVSTRTHQFPTQQTGLTNFQWLVTSVLPLIAQGGLTPQTQTPGTASGQDLARCHQSWSQPPLEAAALAAGRSTANTNIMLCSHGNQSVMFIILSFLEEKRHRSDEENSKSPNGLCWAWADFSCLCWHHSPWACWKGQPCDGPWVWAGSWMGSNASSQIQTVQFLSALCHFEARDTQSTHHSCRSYWMLAKEFSALPILSPIWHDLGMKVLISYLCSVAY